ncbi:hypothetical protein FNV43_RR04593 [Rhamnella rubrinervis]|uniref:Uncharacterized protein n=1 Tax=Rhamnella rubrinervis TaxID=2594499 RepID=A0A8K0MPQ0_9ROSA|nr:hypothetical protein FNV43_RR04593 [Rhamnella rubrinervis]
MGSFISLQSFHVRNNNLSGEFPMSLQNCTELFTLDVGENNLRGSIPGWIGLRLLKMRIISLHFNEFYGHLPDQLCALSSLQILDVSYNNLSGRIPRCFNNFSVMAQKSDYYTNDFSYKVDELFFSPFIEDLLLVMKGRAEEYNKILALVISMDLSKHVDYELLEPFELVLQQFDRNDSIRHSTTKPTEMMSLSA